MANAPYSSGYRAAQGMTAPTDGPDPILIGWIKKASAETGADPTALMATALQESGGVLNGRPGDVASGYASWGPFQLRETVGALGTHSHAWASSYAAVYNRAQAFAKYKVRGGLGAAAVQRPADPRSYASDVDALLARAHALINGSGSVPNAGGTPAVKGHMEFAAGGPTAMLSILNAKSPGEAFSLLGGARTKVLVGASPASPAPLPTPGTGNGRVTLGNYKLIGLPYQGTHNLGNWESDNAIDIAMPARTPIYAAADGTIGSQIGSLGSNDPRFAGQRLHLITNGNELYYQHLEQLTVHAGQHVQKGQIIGYSGALNHIHLGVKVGDPRTYQ